LPWWAAVAESFRGKLMQMFRPYAIEAQFSDIRFSSFFHHPLQETGDSVQTLFGFGAPVNIAV
jgi:hypothetical protein